MCSPSAMCVGGELDFRYDVLHGQILFKLIERLEWVRPRLTPLVVREVGSGVRRDSRGFHSPNGLCPDGRDTLDLARNWTCRARRTVQALLGAFLSGRQM
eukprot:scaffold67089_cov34-Tisochrysis_lutea.AAC.4